MSRFLKILSYPLILPIKFYRKFISPHKAPSCRFTPSCSLYAIEALEEWGPIGLFLALWRVIRCNPFSKGGYDPVPQAPWRRKKKGESAPRETKDGDVSP